MRTTERQYLGKWTERLLKIAWLLHAKHHALYMVLLREVLEEERDE